MASSFFYFKVEIKMLWIIDGLQYLQGDIKTSQTFSWENAGKLNSGFLKPRDQTDRAAFSEGDHAPDKSINQ